MAMGVGRGAGGALASLWILKLLAKKVVFSILRGKKQISPLLAPPGKIFGKIPYCLPWKKSSRHPWPCHDESENLLCLCWIWFQCSIECIKGATIEWSWYISPNCDTFTLTQNSSFDPRWNNRIMACSSQLLSCCTVSSQMN